MQESSFLILSKSKMLYATQRLIEEGKKLGIDLKYREYPTNFNDDLNNYARIINRVSGIDYDDLDLDLLSSAASKVINSVKQSKLLRDKYDQYHFFKENRINTPKTKLFSKNFELPKFQAPFLIKPRRSNQGRGILIANDLEELTCKLKELENKGDYNYIVQSILPKESEWRILCLNGEIIGGLSKDVRNIIIANASKVACEYVPTQNIPEKVLQMANRFNEVTDLFFVGLDIMTVKDNPIMIEVNLTPGFKEFERYSKRNIAKEFLKEMVKGPSR